MMDFVQINNENLPALKKIFGIKEFPICQACGENTSKGNLSIMPSTKKGKFSKGEGSLNAIYLCGSPLCLAEYFGEKARSDVEAKKT